MYLRRTVSQLPAGYLAVVDTRTWLVSTPAKITSQLTVTKDGKPVGYDAEGLVARKGGGYWLAVEGANPLVRLDARARVQEEIPLPADVAAAVTSNGYEGGGR